MKRAVVVVLAVVVAGVVAFVAWWFLRDDAPAEVTLESAVAQVTTTTPATATVAPSEPVGIEGTWTVDTSVGEFSYAESTGTFVGFRVRETLAGLGEVDAVGRTPVVTGTLVVEGTTATVVDIVADLAALTTDDSRRDGKVRGALGTTEFPSATFRLTEPIDFGSAADDGAPVTVQAVGELTVRDVTRPVVFPLQAQLVEGTIVVVGSLRIEFADYDVKVPTAPIVLSADEFGDIELQLFFGRR